MANCGNKKTYSDVTIPISKAERDNNAMHIMEVLLSFSTELGLTDYQCAGIVGNIMTESHCNPSTVNPEDKGQESIGLCQWRGGRNKNLRKFAEENQKSWSDIDLQINFLKNELIGNDEEIGSENASLIALRDANDEEEAANIFCCKFERAKSCASKNCDMRPKDRITNAKDFLVKWRQKKE